MTVDLTRANASPTDFRSRPSCLSLAGMWKSGLLEPLSFALKSTAAGIELREDRGFVAVRFEGIKA